VSSDFFLISLFLLGGELYKERDKNGQAI